MRCLFFSILLTIIALNCDAKAEGNESTNQFNQELSGFWLNLDGSNVLDHPYRSHFDCSESGYYAVHYVPKTKVLQNYWSSEYFKENKYEYDDAVTENRLISNKVLPNIQQYNIFIYYVPMSQLDTTYGCTVESIEVASNAVGYIYINKEGQWQKIYTVQEADIPIYYPTQYFIDLFPEYFK